jgi:hypothetical protein
LIDRFTDAFLDEVRAAVPITEVVGQHVVWDKSKGSKTDRWACCPFHSESGPSFHADDNRGIYHCFGCGVSGDHFKFVTEFNRLSFPDAVAFVAELGGVTMPGQEPRQGAAAADRRTAPPPEEPKPKGKWTMVETDPYTDNEGNLKYEVCRIQWKLPDGSWEIGRKGKPKKTFVQRRPSGRPDKSWAWGLSEGEYMRAAPGRDWKPFNAGQFDEWPQGERGLFLPAVGHTVFDHQGLEIAIAEGKTILLPEGERKARVSQALGFGGTTNSGGANNWQEHFSDYFVGADVVIPMDNDETGREAAEIKARSLRGKAARIRLLDFAALDATFQPGFDIVDWHADGGTSDQLRIIIDLLPDWTPAPLKAPPSSFGARPWREMLQSRVRHEWLVKGLIERAGVCLIPGMSGSGKSFFIVDLGLAIAMGHEYAGRKVTQGLVAYQAGEAGVGAAMRLEGYRKANNISPEQDIPFVLLPGRLDLFGGDEATDKFIAELLAWEAWYGIKLELAIVDTFSAATIGMDEISSKDMGLVVSRLLRIADKCQCAVAVVHHMGADGKRSRGSTILEANVPTIIEIEVTKDKDEDGRPIRRAFLKKNKEGPAQFGWKFVLKQVVVETDEDGVDVTTCVLDRPRGKERSEESKLSDNEKLALDALIHASVDHGKDSPAGLGVDRKVVALEAWFKAARDIWSFIDKKSETAEEREARFDRELKTALQSAGRSLQNAGYIGRSNEHRVAWWTGKEQTRKAPAAPKPAFVPRINEDLRKELSEMDVPF